MSLRQAILFLMGTMIVLYVVLSLMQLVLFVQRWF